MGKFDFIQVAGIFLLKFFVDGYIRQMRVPSPLFSRHERRGAKDTFDSQLASLILHIFDYLLQFLKTVNLVYGFNDCAAL